MVVSIPILQKLQVMYLILMSLELLLNKLNWLCMYTCTIASSNAV